MERAFPGTPVDNICTTIRIEGRFVPEMLQKALETVAKADSSLRLRVTQVNGDVYQYVTEFEKQTYPVYDFSAAGESGAAHWEEAVTREAFPLFDGPLYSFYIFRIAPERGGVVVKTHHLISDGWSQMRLSNRIAAAYLALLSGNEPDAEETPSYRLHVESEREYAVSRRFEADAKYWRSRLNSGDEPATLATVAGARRSPVGRRVSFAISETLNRKIGLFCAEKRVTAFSLFYMALSTYLSRVRRDKGGVIIGVPTFNRMNYTEKRTTGMFVSTLPFGFEAERGWNAEEFQSELLDRWCELLRHQRFPFTEIRRIAHETPGCPDTLFDVVLSYQDSRSLESEDARVTFSGNWHYSGYQAQSLCIHVCSFDGEHRYVVNYDYLTQLFTETEIRRLHGYIVNLLTGALERPDRPLCEIKMLSEEEFERVVFTFNRTDAPVSTLSLNGLLRRACIENAGRAALIHHGERLRFGELFERSERLARRLHARIGDGDEPVAVLLEKGFPLIEAMLAAWLSGHGFLLLYPGLPSGRLREILDGCQARALLTTGELSRRYQIDPDLLFDIGLTGPESPELPSEPSGDSLAYIIYTSGSTGRPKGCVITRDNVRYYARAIAPFMGGRSVLSASNVSFDAFIYESAVALLLGKTVVLPDAREQESPESLAGLITGYGVGHILLTPSRWSAYIKSSAFARAAGRLEAAMCGGEALPAELMQRLRECVGGVLYNQYGPSETTIGAAATALRVGKPITIGKPFANCRLYVLDGARNPLPIGVRGELYVGGKCVGKGYWNAPELTEKAFFDSPFEPGETIYRTGDVGMWTEEGEIAIGGRLDGQVKLRGLRVELGEIAARMEETEGVTAAVASVVRFEAGEVLAAWYCSGDGLSESELLQRLSDALPPYMIPSWIRRVPEIPRNANGKADLRALPQPGEPGTGARAETREEEKALSAFRAALGIPNLGVEDDFYAFGGDSLRALELIAELENAFGERIGAEQLIAARTARRVAALYACEPSHGTADAFALTKADRQDMFPPTGSQKSLYFVSAADPTGVSYNMPGIFEIPSLPDANRLEAAIDTLVRGEPLLRTGFAFEEGELVARVLPEVSFRLERVQANDVGQAWDAFVRPFDLKKPPLLRAALFEDSEGKAYFLIDIHHIVSDGGSVKPLLTRLRAICEGRNPEWPRYSFVDYAWTRSRVSEREWSAREEFWLARAKTLSDPLVLPTDYPRGKRFDFKGDACETRIDERAAKRLRDFCADRKITPFAAIMGAFGVLLWRITGRSRFAVGTPVSARRLRETREMTGPLINTLPLILELDADIRAEEYLSRVFESAAELIDHADVSTDRLARLCGTENALSGNPLFSALLSYMPGDDLPGRLPFAVRNAKMDLVLNVTEDERGIRLSLEYASSLFSGDTARLYARGLTAALTALTSGKNPLLSEISALAPSDWARLYEKPFRTRAPFLDMRIERQIDMALTSMEDEGVLCFHGQWVTGGETRRASDSLAALLIENGVRPGDAVALCVRRAPLLITGILAILKAGASYMPIAEDTPSERAAYMLDIADAKLVLADANTYKTLSALGFSRPVLLADDIERPFAPPQGLEVTDDIHVLFTSGSTGKPKGARLTHRNLANLLATLETALAGVNSAICSTSFVFDTFFTETLAILAMGGKVILADEEEMALPHGVAALIEEHGADLLQMTPSRLSMCMGSDRFSRSLSRLKVVLAAGEAFPMALVEALRASGDFRILNAYGPTETAVYATYADITKENRVTIGKAVYNSRVYILNGDGVRAYPTAEGEICVAGENVGREYANRPDLTEAAFVPDPFYPGQRMYRTGDIGRLLADGDIAFCGRRDFQVKLNGRRVELEEITGEMLRSGFASEAAVVPVRKEDGSMLLRAFAVCKQGDLPALRERLREKLPPYMIPSELFAASSIPKTATGKADMRALLEKGAPAASPAPEKTAADALEAVWQKTLGRSDIDPDISFFEMGGTSLTALSALSLLFNEGVSMTLAQFYDSPTLNGQRRAMRMAGEADASSGIAEAETPAAIPPVAEKALSEDPSLEAAVSVAPCEKPDCLLTGATGYLGAHLLREFLRTRSGRVFALVRGGSERLTGVLEEYFGAEWTAQNADRVIALNGDVTRESLGVDFSDESLRGIGALVHAAADTRHFGREEDSLRSNVYGTQNAVAAAERLGARYLHISTMSVSGDRIAQEPNRRAIFDEEDFDIGQNWRDNVYVKTKFLAERVVRERMTSGLPAKIYRVGRLVGRAEDGRFQRNPEGNAFRRFVRGLQRLNAIPEAFCATPVEMTPVDECARALWTLDEGRRDVYHLCSPRPISLRELATAVCPAAKILPEAEFHAALASALLGPEAMELTALLEIYNQFRLSPPTITVGASITEKELLSLGFEWSRTPAQRLLREFFE